MRSSIFSTRRRSASFFATEPIDQVYLAAAKVGGIHANMTYPAQFIYENLMIAANVTHQAFLANVKRLLFLGSSCIYPRLAEQPIREDACSAASSSRPTSPTRSPRSLASSCARATTGSTAPRTASTTAA
jgi:GDP-L-fucose synthase